MGRGTVNVEINEEGLIGLKLEDDFARILAELPLSEEVILALADFILDDTSRTIAKYQQIIDREKPLAIRFVKPSSEN